MQAGGRDYFDKARSGAAAMMLAAGAAALIGIFMEWVTITPPIRVPEDQAHRLDGFTGLETSDGWVILVGSVIILVSAVLLVIRKRSFYGWLAFFASMLIGGIAIADYRGIEELFFNEMNRIGKPSPAFGLTLIAAAALVGLIGAVTGIAASPRRMEPTTTSG